MIKKSHAKVNIFLKIVGKRGNYHEIVSRFVKVENLYDTISFVCEENDTFNLKGSFGCSLEKNTIYKAYLLMRKIDVKVDEFFKKNTIKIEKNIPEFAGLGGGSSNAATFMLMVNECLNLGLSKDELAALGIQIGADVPFFIYEYNSANVSGIGEKVTNFEENKLFIETFTPKIQCNTGVIFTAFRNYFYKELTKEESDKLLKMCSKDVLKNYSIGEANDLYAPAVKEYKELQNYAKDQWFFSGSGSSFFKVKE